MTKIEILWYNPTETLPDSDIECYFIVCNDMLSGTYIKECKLFVEDSWGDQFEIDEVSYWTSDNLLP